MVLYLLLCNKNDKANNKWLSLPTTDKILFETLDELTDDEYDDIIVIDYKSKIDIDFTIYDGSDLYDVNKNIERLNQVATDNEIIALSELYSHLDDVVSKAQRGVFEFYPNKSLKDVAYELGNTERYRYYRNSDGDVDDWKIINDLCRLGYEETSTGVILMLES